MERDLNMEAIEILLNNDDLKKAFIKEIESDNFPDGSLLHKSTVKENIYRAIEEPSRIIIDTDINPFAIPGTGIAFLRRIVEIPDGVDVVGIQRPITIIKDDTFPDIDESPARDMNDYKVNINNAIKATGAIKRTGQDKILGTAWLIEHNIIITNWHVPREYIFNDQFKNGYEFEIDFKKEYGSNEDSISKIKKKILYVPSDEEKLMMSTTGTASFDFVLLQIDTPHTPREPIKLSTNPIQSGMRICAIGYPQYDLGYNPQSSIERLFQGVKDQVKRISYGEVMNSENNSVFTHDCSVVSGNSGSVICAYGIGAAIGIHTSGITRVGNYAIPASIIAEKLEEAKTRLAA